MIEIDGTDELNIQFAILNLMSDQRIWTNAELKSKLAKTLPLTDHDRLRSKTRPTEAVWENRVNNALSPSRKSSLYGQGHVSSVGHGEHQITQQGLDYVNSD